MKPSQTESARQYYPGMRFGKGNTTHNWIDDILLSLIVATRVAVLLLTYCEFYWNMPFHRKSVSTAFFRYNFIRLENRNCNFYNLFRYNENKKQNVIYLLECYLNVNMDRFKFKRYVVIKFTICLCIWYRFINRQTRNNHLKVDYEQGRLLIEGYFLHNILVTT